MVCRPQAETGMSAGLGTRSGGHLYLAGDDARARGVSRSPNREAVIRLPPRLSAHLNFAVSTQEEYRAERTRIERELASLAPPPGDMDIERAATLVADLGHPWADASADERRELAGQLFDAIYLDLDNPTALYRALKEPLLPLRSALDGCTWVTDGVQGRSSSTHLPVACGVPAA